MATSSGTRLKSTRPARYCQIRERPFNNMFAGCAMHDFSHFGRCSAVQLNSSLDSRVYHRPIGLSIPIRPRVLLSRRPAPHSIAHCKTWAGSSGAAHMVDHAIQLVVASCPDLAAIPRQYTRGATRAQSAPPSAPPAARPQPSPASPAPRAWRTARFPSSSLRAEQAAAPLQSPHHRPQAP